MVAISAHLQISVEAFQDEYQVHWDPQAQSWRIDATDGDGCPLLIGNACSVHPVKPVQCSAFPFWSELLDDRDEWRAAKRFCPGMDASGGRLYSAREIRAIRRKADAK